MYNRHPAPPDLADSNGFYISDDVISASLSRIYSRKSGRADIDPDMFAATTKTIRNAAAQGISDAVDSGTAVPGKDFLYQLRHSADVFSAFKTHSQQNDLARLLTDDKGKLRSFSDFRRTSEPLIGKYNRTWLRTEYNTAVNRAHQAANWQQYQAEKDVMPCLQWIESTSPNPGEDHSIFWGTIRHVDDPFWDEHRPSDRWNCQCSLEQTDKAPTSTPSGGDDPHPGLDNNPGRDGNLFAQSHPYYPQNCSACPFATNKLRALYHGLTDDRDCNDCPYIDRAIARTQIEQRRTEYNAAPMDCQRTYFDESTGGYLVTDKARIQYAAQNKQETVKYEKEKHMCLTFAKAGDAVRHLREVPRVPSPDVTINGTPADLKSLSSHNNIVKEAKKAVYHQGADLVLFEFSKQSDKIAKEISNLSRMGIHGKYYYKGNEKEILSF